MRSLPALFILGLFICQLNQAIAYEQHGIASVYWEPQRLAIGGRFNPHGISVAHRTLPLGSYVKVTNKTNGKSVVAIVNDRGPAKWTRRIVDLSLGAASKIGLSKQNGIAPVKLETTEKIKKDPQQDDKHNMDISYEVLKYKNISYDD